MLTYKNEAAFSRSLVSAMRNKGIFVQRIESGETGKGIPDIYAIVGTQAIWIELKRVHHSIHAWEKIPWRPGQQAWLHEVWKRGQLSMTLCCFDDAILRIHHKDIYKNDMVNTLLHPRYKTLASLLK